MNFEGRIFTFRSLERQRTQVTENEFYVVLGLYLLMGIIQNHPFGHIFINNVFFLD
jgi:hypothetical protein